MKEKAQNSSWLRVRETLNTIHLWLGIGSGLVLFIVCLTGTIYTFSTEIQKLIDSQLYNVEVPDGANRLSPTTLISIVLDSVNADVVQSIGIPGNRDASYQITVAKLPAEVIAASSGGVKAKAITYFVNPYTGEVLGTNETSSSAFFLFVFRMHRWLLLDTAIGRPIVGGATLIFVIIIITGLVIWFPKKLKNWKQGLKIKTSGKWKRINHDLHTTLGLYASVFLLVMALTGLTWSFEWYKKGFTNVLGGKKDETPPTSIYTGAGMASIEQILTASEPYYNPGEDIRIVFPSDSAGVVVLSKTSTSFFATSVADRISIDQYSAEIRKVDLFSDRTFGAKVLSSVKALHIGSFYGTFSKVVYFIACLIATSLPVTGTIIWINKLRKNNQKVKKHKARPALVREAVEIED